MASLHVAYPHLLRNRFTSIALTGRDPARLTLRVGHFSEIGALPIPVPGKPNTKDTIHHHWGAYSTGYVNLKTSGRLAYLLGLAVHLSTDWSIDPFLVDREFRRIDLYYDYRTHPLHDRFGFNY